MWHTSRRLWTFATTVVILGLAFGVLCTRWQTTLSPLWTSIVSTSSSSSIHDSSTQVNRWELHPEAHATRAATVLRYHWKITADERRPDGVLKEVYLINDRFLGPTIEARPGDRLIIEVENLLIVRNESVTFHWHGLQMRGFNSMDGAAGVTQDAIHAGQKFTYDFTLDEEQAGTFWYHAHSAVQRADGLFGGLIIHEAVPRAAPAFEREYLILAGDWYHRPAVDVLDWYLNADSFGMEPVPDSILVNGEGSYTCDDAVPARPVDCRNSTRALNSLRIDTSTPSRIRIVNVGAYASFSLGIPKEELRIVSVDGGNAVKSSSRAVDEVSMLAPGQRLDILLPTWQQSDPKLRISLATERFKYSNLALTPVQQFDIISSSNPRPTSAGGEPNGQHGIANLSELSSPERPFADGFEADMVLLLYTMTEKLAHLDYIPSGNINRTTWLPQSPPLTSGGRNSWNQNQFVPHIPYIAEKPLWVDIVVNNLDEDDHPFHIHGYDVYVMQKQSATLGWGSWNPFETDVSPGGAYNTNPLKHDTVIIPRRGYAVLRLRADNPGIWMFHCHVMWHMAGGMAMAFDVS